MALCAFSLNSVPIAFRFLLMNPSDLLEVFVILFTWVFQEMSLVMSTPRYLPHVTTSRISPWRLYDVGRGECDWDLVICITWHLLGSKGDRPSWLGCVTILTGQSAERLVFINQNEAEPFNMFRK